MLVDHLVDVVLASDPSAEAERLLRALVAFTGGRKAALFELQQDQLRLFSSRGLDQAALETVEDAWLRRRGEMDDEGPMTAGHSLLFPVNLQGQLLGLLYVDGGERAVADPRDLQALAQFTRIAGHALARRRSEPARYLAATSLDDMARDQLLVLLEQHEWNISRVARELGVTRPTIYARLERYGLPRLRPPKLHKRQPV
jgi:transcriptional regulator with GAF, ATPase, and Fis domain